MNISSILEKFSKNLNYAKKFFDKLKLRRENLIYITMRKYTGKLNLFLFYGLPKNLFIKYTSTALYMHYTSTIDVQYYRSGADLDR